MYLFVYGSLKKSSGHSAHALLGDDCAYLDDGYFYGKVYHVHGYPAAVVCENTTEKVCGELYDLLNAEFVFKRLDDYEECSTQYPPPHDYLRKQITVYNTRNQPIQAWCYVYNLPEG